MEKLQAINVGWSHWMRIDKACNLFLFGQQHEIGLANIEKINRLAHCVLDGQVGGWLQERSDQLSGKQNVVDIHPFMMWCVQRGFTPFSGLIETLEGCGVKFGNGMKEDHESGMEFGSAFKAHIGTAILTDALQSPEISEDRREEINRELAIHRQTLQMVDLARVSFPEVSPLIRPSCAETSLPDGRKTLHTNRTGTNTSAATQAKTKFASTRKTAVLAAMDYILKLDLTWKEKGIPYSKSKVAEAIKKSYNSFGLNETDATAIRDNKGDTGIENDLATLAREGHFSFTGGNPDHLKPLLQVIRQPNTPGSRTEQGMFK